MSVPGEIPREAPRRSRGNPEGSNTQATGAPAKYLKLKRLAQARGPFGGSMCWMGPTAAPAPLARTRG